jgi:hypothetical protein
MRLDNNLDRYICDKCRKNLAEIEINCGYCLVFCRKCIVNINGMFLLEKIKKGRRPNEPLKDKQSSKIGKTISLEEHKMIGPFLKSLRNKILHNTKYKSKLEYRNSREAMVIKLLDSVRDNMEEIMYKDHIDMINKATAIKAEIGGIGVDYVNVYYGNLKEEDKKIMDKLEILSGLENTDEEVK